VAQVQRYGWDDFVSDIESVGDAVGDAVDDAANTVGDVVDDAADIVGDVIDTVGDAVTDTVDTVGTAVTDAVDWATTAAGKAATAAARALVAALGGSVAISGTGIVITIPDMTLFEPFPVPIVPPIRLGQFIPLAGEGAVIGPIVLLGVLGVQVRAEPSVTAYLGPGRLRNISVTIDPIASRYSATGQLYVGAAISELIVLSGALRAEGYVLGFEPPVFIKAAVEGGLRGTFRGSALAGLQETVTLSYVSGAVTLDLMTRLQLGALVEASADAFANIQLYDFVVCELVYPLGEWQTSRANAYDLPISIGFGSGGSPITVGPITSAPIPIEEIETGLNRSRPQTRCLSLEEIIAELCRRMILDPELCLDEADEGEPATGILGSCIANDNLGDVADSFISRCCKASIRSEFPGELLQETLGTIKKGKTARHKKAWKLLNDGRFKKPGVTAGGAGVTALGKVMPSGTPTVNNSASSNDCTPNTAGAVLGWDVVSADTSNWGVNVTALTLAGHINIKPWPSQPTNMVVPNTANPVDGGNINNVAGSKNRWKFAIDDMADYDTSGSGGAGPYWHSTDASRAHEFAHWHEDYKADAVMSAAGGDWPKTNTDLDALREPKSSSPTPAAARAALQPRVDAILRRWRVAVVNRWNALIGGFDKPGAGGRGYAAGMRVLNTLIARVRSYKDSKGW
jgi:hypothetical protein